MKKWLSIILLIFLCSACGTRFTKQEVGGCSVLNVYNWGEYIGEDVISHFERQYGVRVNYSLFASNEEMYTKLLGGTSYDVIVPSDYMIERMIAEDMLWKLDKSVLTNLTNLYPGTLQKAYDPDNVYSVPYFWGNVGIVYDKTIIQPADVQREGWNVLKNPKYKDKIYMYDSERDSFMIALKALGYSMNTQREEELQQAYEWLSELHQTMNPAYVTDEAIDGLIYGEKAMGVMYSGDAAYILGENKNMQYYVPESGTNIWTDAMVIPKNARCPALAHEYINYILSYEASLDNSLTVGYASSNKEVVEELSTDGGEYEGNAAYLPRSGYAQDEVYSTHEEVRKLISELWVKVKNQ